MKMLGMVLIVLSASLLGFLKAERLRKKEEALLEMKFLFQRFRAGISFSKVPLQELINSNSDLSVCRNAQLLSTCRDDPLSALRQAGRSYFIGKKEVGLFESFLSGLGSSGICEQLDNIDLHLALLEEYLIKAKDERDRKSRLYRVLGVSSGLAFCFLIL